MVCNICSGAGVRLSVLRAKLARISSAVLAQTKGAPPALCAAMNSSMAASRGTDASMHAASQLLCGQLGEPALNEFEPGRVGRGEVDVEPRPLGEPGPDDQRLVGRVVVHDDVHVEVGRHAFVDAVEELAELDGPVAAVRLGDDGAGLDVERCKGDVVPCRR